MTDVCVMGDIGRVVPAKKRWIQAKDNFSLGTEK
jgi:hypothetical protein